MSRPMRYTLRLLTLQQFERAAGLICRPGAPDQRETRPGRRPISIGLWVGQAATPNTLADARLALNKLKQASRSTRRIPMQLTQLPLVRYALDQPQLPVRLAGRGTIMLPERDCDFRAGFRLRRRLGRLRASALSRDRHRRQVRHDGLARADAATVQLDGERRATGPDHPGRAAPDLRARSAPSSASTRRRSTPLDSDEGDTCARR